MVLPHQLPNGMEVVLKTLLSMACL